MPYIIYWIIVIIIAIFAYVSMPRPKAAKPPALGDFEVPTAQDGREVIDCGGTCWIDDPNVIFFGNLATYPVKTKSGK